MTQNRNSLITGCSVGIYVLLIVLEMCLLFLLFSLSLFFFSFYLFFSLARAAVWEIDYAYALWMITRMFGSRGDWRLFRFIPLFALFS